MIKNWIGEIFDNEAGDLTEIGDFIISELADAFSVWQDSEHGKVRQEKQLIYSVGGFDTVYFRLELTSVDKLNYSNILPGQLTIRDLKENIDVVRISVLVNVENSSIGVVKHEILLSSGVLLL